MVNHAPLTAAGDRQKRPQPVAKNVRDAIKLMVFGRLDDPGCKPLDFIAAARECGIKPDVMRRYLDRPQVRALLMAERRAFRAAICASNEAALLDIRNNAVNAMARIGAIRQLEQMETTDAEVHSPGRQVLPGLIVQINAVLPHVQPAPMIEHDPTVPEQLSPHVFGVRPVTRRE
jgi:hypothetical protein